MRRRASSVITGVLVALAMAGAGAAGLPSHGPMVGALAIDSAAVWARWDEPGTARVLYRIGNTGTYTAGPPVVIDPGNDLIGRFSLPGLKANTTYNYKIEFTADADGTVTSNSTAYFRTPMKLPTSLSFAVLADFMTKEKAAPALRAATTPRPDFALIIGDLDHSDPARVPGSQEYYPPEQADTVLANLRRMRRDMRDADRPVGADFIKAFVTSKTAQQLQIPLYYIWDDHDFCKNGADGACPFGDLARQVYQEYFIPARNNGFDNGGCEKAGPWQSFAWGKLASFFLLDARSLRGPLGSSQLGECQKQWLKDALATSTTTWKFIVTPVTFNPGTKPWDGWGAFAAERSDILDFIQGHSIRNVVALSADLHSGGALDDGSHAGLPEASAPHANMPGSWVNTYCRLDPNDKGLLTSTPGTWTLGGLLDPNLQGALVSCLGTDYSRKRVGPLPPPPYPLDGTLSPGFLKIDVSATTATIRVMDASGQLKRGYAADASPADMQLDLVAQ